MKAALVTGCSKGIGREITRTLLSDDWRIFGISRTFPTGGQTWPVDRFIWLKSDLGKPYIDMELRRLLRPIVRLDAVVHCAAIQGPIGPLWECDEAEWEQTIRVNLLGAYHVTNATLPLLRRSADGRVLLFSGGGAFNPRPDYSAYAVAKAGVVSLMETLADELRHSTVTVNCVSPGFVPTGLDPRAVVLGADPDGSIAMARAVACVRHLLGPAAYGVSGKTISAEYDDWESITPETVVALNASVLGTRDRHLIDRLVERARAFGRVIA